MMWAIRRATITIRSHAYCLGCPRASCATSEIVYGNIEHGVGNHVHDQLIDIRCYQPKRFYHSPSIPMNFFVGTRGLSSHTGAKSNGDVDDLEDGFSELETPVGSESVGENNMGEENAEEVISQHELSDDDSEDNLLVSAHDELDLSDDEAVVKGDKVSWKKTSTSPLFKVIMDSPRHSIHSAINKWVEEGNTLVRTDISVAIVNLQKRRMFGRALQLLEWVEENKQLDFVEHDYASRLGLIAKVHGISKAEKYIEKIPQSYQGEIMYRTLLAHFATSVNVKKAEQVFNKMRNLGFPLTVFSCNHLLVLYKRVDRKKIADVLLMMEKENVKPSMLTYKLLIDTKGRANDIMGMEQVIETMKADGLEADLLTQATVARYYVIGGLHEKAEAVLGEMEGGDIRQNRGACKLLLPLYASLGKADEVGRIWKVCEKAPLLHESLAAIEAWGAVGRVENAEAVFEKMLETWKKLSPKYYAALLKVYANHKLLAKGKDLAKRMSDNGCQIGPYTWDALVKLYAGAGEVEKADSILQKASQQGPMKPLYSSYIAVLDKYAQRGDIHNAEKIFHRSRQAGYVGSMHQYQALLQAYANAKAPAYGFRERLKADNIYPNKTVASLLSQIDAFKKTAISDLID